MLGADSALFGIKGWHHGTVISFVLKLLELTFLQSIKHKNAAKFHYSEWEDESQQYSDKNLSKAAAFTLASNPGMLEV